MAHGQHREKVGFSDKSLRTADFHQLCSGIRISVSAVVTIDRAGGLEATALGLKPGMSIAPQCDLDTLAHLSGSLVSSFADGK